MQNLSNHTKEIELLESIRQGDEKAFQRLYRIHVGRVAHEVSRTIPAKEQTMEVVHDTFLTLWHGRAEICTIRNMEAYLITVARRLSLNALKQTVRRAAIEKRFALDNESELHNLPEDNSEELQYSWLNKAIDRLPPQQKRVYQLSRHERKKYVEIAEEMQISRESVKKYLQIASDSIRKYLVNNRDSIVSIFFIFLPLQYPPF
ncbi:RNA polymerase sigma factor [Sphingobacterium deserti]|uniref:RNA polymerase, sigma-24 subunit, ECF subfamily n=1 Tax=Sphingobacterium deserti TaxID=1229276 RepID=A0A0B8T6W1_9SPHI|nr:sigma-70 family RNA polymerase sigma factor [Sphingobacterium deserti]KGE13170.1 RNA polymerase, sigma-24 subunit, ECF subfamily [Sphingobacterium deserti]